MTAPDKSNLCSGRGCRAIHGTRQPKKQHRAGMRRVLSVAQEGQRAGRAAARNASKQCGLVEAYWQRRPGVVTNGNGNGNGNARQRPRGEEES